MTDGARLRFGPRATGGVAGVPETLRLSVLDVAAVLFASAKLCRELGISSVVFWNYL